MLTQHLCKNGTKALPHQSLHEVFFTPNSIITDERKFNIIPISSSSISIIPICLYLYTYIPIYNYIMIDYIYIPIWHGEPGWFKSDACLSPPRAAAERCRRDFCRVTRNGMLRMLFGHPEYLKSWERVRCSPREREGVQNARKNDLAKCRKNSRTRISFVPKHNVVNPDWEVHLGNNEAGHF